MKKILSKLFIIILSILASLSMMTGCATSNSEVNELVEKETTFLTSDTFYMNTANTNNSNSNASRENTNAPVANSSIDINKTINTDTLQFPYHAGEDAEMEQRYTSRSWDFDAQK